MSGLERFRHNNLLPAAVDPAELGFNLARDGSGAVWAKAYLGGSLAKLTPDGRVAATEAGLATNTIASAHDGSLLVARGCTIERRLGARRTIISLPAAVRPGTKCVIGKMVDDGEALWVNLSGRWSQRRSMAGRSERNYLPLCRRQGDPPAGNPLVGLRRDHLP